MGSGIWDPIDPRGCHFFQKNSKNLYSKTLSLPCASRVAPSIPMALQWSESFDAFHHKEATSTKLSDMAAHVSRVGEKILRLDVVFKKAIDVASNSLNNADLDKCFGDFKSHYGNALPNLFMNMIAKSQVNIEVSRYPNHSSSFLI